MPKYCNIKECKKISKKKSKDTIPTLYLCAAHSKLFEEIEFVKIVFKHPLQNMHNRK